MAMVLLAALMAVPMTGWMLRSAPPAYPDAAGCHKSEHQNPYPQSSNYACCKIGHSIALPQVRFTLPFSCLHVVLLTATVTPLQANPKAASFPSQAFASPPASAPLRI
jgi:hypothetical protein